MCSPQLSVDGLLDDMVCLVRRESTLQEQAGDTRHIVKAGREHKLSHGVRERCFHIHK